MLAENLEKPNQKSSGKNRSAGLPRRRRVGSTERDWTAGLPRRPGARHNEGERPTGLPRRAMETMLEEREEEPKEANGSEKARPAGLPRRPDGRKRVMRIWQEPTSLLLVHARRAYRLGTRERTPADQKNGDGEERNKTAEGENDNTKAADDGNDRLMLAIVSGIPVGVAEPSNGFGAWLGIGSRGETAGKARKHANNAGADLMNGDTEVEQRSDETQMAEDSNEVKISREQVDACLKQGLVAARDDVSENETSSPRNVDDFPAENGGAFKSLPRDAVRIRR